MLAGYRVFTDKVTGSKESRALPFAAQLQGGNVYLIAGDWARLTRWKASRQANTRRRAHSCDSLAGPAIFGTCRGWMRIEAWSTAGAGAR
jgi:hypothetical protein